MSDNSPLSRRKALLRFGSLAAAAYVAPALLTISAHASTSGSSGTSTSGTSTSGTSTSGSSSSGSSSSNGKLTGKIIIKKNTK